MTAAIAAVELRASTPKAGGGAGAPAAAPATAPAPASPAQPAATPAIPPAVATPPAMVAAPAAVSALSSLLQDPAKALGLVQQEARNAVSRKPEGVEMLPYSTITRGDGYELRRYDSVSVASTEVVGGAGGAGGALSGGALVAYNSLAAYFLGGNGQGEAMELTSPVRLDQPAPGFGGALLSVMLPTRYTATTAPPPSEPSPAVRRRSYDCADQPSAARAMVCRDAGLARMDQRMKQAYAAALAAGVPEEELAAEQEDWLSIREEAARYSRRSVANIYRQRIDELESMSERSWQ